MYVNNLNVLFATLMGLRKSEIIGIKYENIDFIRRKLKLETQLGRRIEDEKEDCEPKSLTKQEVPLKTKSSVRELGIPDLLFEAILEERKLYEKRRSRRINDKHNPFCDKGKANNNLPDLPWHKLRTTYTTILAKNDFSLKAIAILLGHSSEIITFENYTDKNEIIQDCLTELEPFIDSVVPKQKEENINDCTEIEIDDIMEKEFENILST